MSDSYYLTQNLAAELGVPEKGIARKTLYDNDQARAILFAFAAGEELKAHRAAMPALLQFIQGEAELMLGGDSIEAAPGTFTWMPSGLEHSIKARTPMMMLLMLVKNPKPG